MKTKWQKFLLSFTIGGAVILGTSAAGCFGDSGNDQDTYDKCKAAGGETKSGICVKPGFRCDGDEGSDGAYQGVWYICESEPPVWTKENPQPK
jgi:hypothetical protein